MRINRVDEIDVTYDQRKVWCNKLMRNKGGKTQTWKPKYEHTNGIDTLQEVLNECNW